MRRLSALLFLFPLSAFADFSATDSANLADIKSGLLADSGSGSFVSQGLTTFTFLNQRVSAWGGNFIKTVGDAANKFVNEFGSAGWFTAVKASIGVIQADVGRINTALTDVNTHLDIVEGDVSSIKDNTESINTSVESIDTSVENIKTTTSHIDTSISDLTNSISSFKNKVFSTFKVPYTQTILYRALPIPTSSIAATSAPNIQSVTRSQTSYDNFYDALLKQIFEIQQQGVYDNSMFASQLLKQHVIYLSSVASTNLLQRILDTNDVWYAKIYDRIPTNLTASASGGSNDWHYTASTSLSSSPVLQNLSPDISRDVLQSYLLSPPQLTGDFKTDVILLLAHAQQVAASGSSVNMDILTNLQVVANSILSSSAEVEKKKRELQTTISNIEGEYQTHQNDLDSTESSFDLVDNNNSAKSFLQNASNVETSFGALNVQDIPDSYRFSVPVPFSQFIGNSASFGDYFHITVDVSQIRGVCRSIRAVFGVFWWVIGFGILFGLLGRGVRLLAWISNFINPGSGNQILTSSGGKS